MVGPGRRSECSFSCFRHFICSCQRFRSSQSVISTSQSGSYPCFHVLCFATVGMLTCAVTTWTPTLQCFNSTLTLNTLTWLAASKTVKHSIFAAAVFWRSAPPVATRSIADNLVHRPRMPEESLMRTNLLNSTPLDQRIWSWIALLLNWRERGDFIYGPNT